MNDLEQITKSYMLYRYYAAKGHRCEHQDILATTRNHEGEEQIITMQK
jgi:hypothetical protein